MSGRMRFAVRSFIAACALFGLTSAGVMIFAPHLMTDVGKGFTAYGVKGYQLPQNHEAPANSEGDLRALKTFSKVFVNIAKQARPGLIYIVTKKTVIQNRSPFPFPDDFFFPFFPPGGGGGPRQRGIQEGAGSGFLVDLKNGYVVTNNHVVEGADEITASTYDERKFKATLVGADKSVDIAVLKLDSFTPANLKALSFADSDEVEVGDWAVALGAPFELPQTLTVGVISALGRGSEIGGMESSFANFIQTDAAINPGNSGGPLLNLQGKVIGVNTAIISRAGPSSAGIGLAIPSNWAVRTTEMMINNNGKVVRGFLGISLSDVGQLSPDVKKQLEIPKDTLGALVRQVVKGSPADKAGLKPYDVIVSLKGQIIKNSSQLRNNIAFTNPGSKVALGVLRDGKVRPIEVVVGELSENSLKGDDDAPAAAPSGKKTSLSAFGIEVTPLTPELRKELQLQAKQGLVVTNITQGSVASESESIRPKDVILEVNKRSVKSLADLETAMKSNKNKVLLLVERGNGQMLIVLSR